MKQITVLEKYPVFTLEVTKEETSYQSVDEILAHLKVKIEEHPIATYIGEFDHYAHTTSLAEGEIADEILAAKNIICCFGKKLPKAVVLAVRPRSIGVAELEDRYIVSFLEAPNPDANNAMENWVKEIANKQ
jgi:F420-0:gamma-glutamyl ligase